MVQLPLCACWLAVMSAPWLLSTARELRSREFRARLRRVPGVSLLIAWTTTYCVLAALINHVTPRYLLPVAAPLSIVIGGLLHRVDTASLQGRLWLVLPVGGTLITVCTIVVGIQLVDRPGLLLAGMLLALAANFVIALRVRRWPAAGQGLAIA